MYSTAGISCRESTSQFDSLALTCCLTPRTKQEHDLNAARRDRRGDADDDVRGSNVGAVAHGSAMPPEGLGGAARSDHEGASSRHRNWIQRLANEHDLFFEFAASVNDHVWAQARGDIRWGMVQGYLPLMRFFVGAYTRMAEWRCPSQRRELERVPNARTLSASIGGGGDSASAAAAASARRGLYAIPRWTPLEIRSALRCSSTMMRNAHMLDLLIQVAFFTTNANLLPDVERCFNQVCWSRRASPALRACTLSKRVLLLRVLRSLPALPTRPSARPSSSRSGSPGHRRPTQSASDGRNWALLCCCQVSFYTCTVPPVVRIRNSQFDSLPLPSLTPRLLPVTRGVRRAAAAACREDERRRSSEGAEAAVPRRRRSSGRSVARVAAAKRSASPFPMVAGVLSPSRPER